MPIVTESKTLGINDAKLFELLSDTSVAVSYAAGIDIPGITQLKVSPNFIEKELRGDEHIMDQYSRLDFIDWSFENAKISLDALAIMIGGAVTAAGTTPNQTQTYKLKNTDLPKFFKIEGKSDYSDIGDVHVLLYKCKANKVEYTLVGEDYAKVTASGRAIGLAYNGDVKDIVFNETANAIVTGASDTTPPTVTVSPADTDTNVAITSNIVWTFSEAIKADCINGANFMVIKASDGSVVVGTLTRTSETVVTFDPTSNLSGATAYIAIANTNVKDLYNNALAANSITNFTTA